MRTRHRYSRTFLASLAAGAILLTACGCDDGSEPAASSDDAADEAAGSDDEGQVGGPEDDEGEDGASEDDADAATEADATDEPDEPEEPPFDPAQEVAIHDYEVVPFMTDEVVQPFEELAVPTDLVFPATTALVTWEEVDGWTGQNRMATSGALRIHEGDPDTVMGFFRDRLPDQGWELVEEEASDSSVRTVWERSFPLDDGHPAGSPMPDVDSDVVGDTTLRMTYLGSNEPGTLQFRIRTEARVEYS